MKRRILIVSLILALLVLYRVFNLSQYFSLSYVKASQEKAAVLYAEHQAVVLLGYFGLYVLATALSLPGAVVLTLAGGALFGFWPGAVVVSFSSTVGATLACFVSRFLLREWVQKKLGEQTQNDSRGNEAGGEVLSFYPSIDSCIPFLRGESRHGFDPYAVTDLLLGIAAGDAAGDNDLCQCRERTCKD